ncbi:NAD dependent epimerase dehydratase family [Fusarium phyllophilum]|uniref:NAD dependent epimerase dehydratase family n=1 Tax=Fusarium phyllophilum TaxID=47803 RepID=A0A8H5NGQ2_9HYPO|nr:NAD dependent epimerase dehydratase family [Fusarium phyllophilum]
MSTAIVAGATGILGREIVHQLGQNPQRWNKVYSLSRSQKEEFPSNVEHRHIDLTGNADEVAKNLQDALVKSRIDKNLKRFLLVTGAKQYGVHLGPVKNPMLESDPWQTDQSTFPPNFYYRQQDILKKFCDQSDGRISWNVTYPNDVIGYARGNFMNLATAVGIYAATSKELGKDLIFPGSERFYTGFDCFTSADLHAKFCEWAVLEPKAANEAFNVVNGDVESWQNLWPKVAERFGTRVDASQFQKSHPLGSSTDLNPVPPLSLHEERSGLKGVTKLGKMEQTIDLTKWSQQEEIKEA